MIRWPWSRGNRHAWGVEVADADEVTTCQMRRAGVWVYVRHWTACRNCGMVPDPPGVYPRFGCTALPLPATRAPERSALPVVGEA